MQARNQPGLQIYWFTQLLKEVEKIWIDCSLIAEVTDFSLGKLRNLDTLYTFSTNFKKSQSFRLLFSSTYLFQLISTS